MGFFYKMLRKSKKKRSLKIYKKMEKSRNRNKIKK